MHNLLETEIVQLSSLCVKRKNETNKSYNELLPNSASIHSIQTRWQREREREREKLRDTEANKVSANEFRRLRVHARETMRKIGRYVVPTGGVFKGGARERARFLWRSVIHQMRAIQEKLAGVRGAPIPETNDETAEGADAISQSATVPRFGRFILFPARGVIERARPPVCISSSRNHNCFAASFVCNGPCYSN